MKKIIKVFFCILTCLIISIPQIYAEESKTTKELSEAVEEKKDENVEESLDKGKKEVTEEPVEQSVLETIEKPAEVTSNGTTELPKTESTSETEEKPDEEPKKEPSICYTTHIQDIGWQNQVKDGEMAGTEGQAKRLEAIKITLKDLRGVKIKYQTHIQDIGWQDWKSDGQVAGTEGQSKRIEAIQIELENLEDYTIEYKVHIQDIGWTNWYRDGEMAGTVGKGLRIEGIKIRIVSKYKKHYIGIDVSHWQGDINYEKLVASQKIDFMITKVGWYSENNKRFIVDSKFEKNYKLAKQNKIPLGIYLYSYAKNVEDAKLEANELIKYLKSSGNSSFELPIFYDIEEDSQISYGKKAITDITIAFCETMKNAGYEVGVYSYSYWLNNYMETLRLPADYSLWGADYGTNNNGQIPSDLDKYSETYDIWQFTDKAQIDGINGYVDMNVCYKKYF